MSSATITELAPVAATTAVPVTTTTLPPTPQTAPASGKGRKSGAAGGGKAWTEEEEVYLLQMRLERVAYKKIASHLEKTELACRLHYHQLSHGGHRRKQRTSSVSSTSSSTTPSPTSTPSSAPSFSPVNANGAIQKPSSSRPKPKGKPLLPKPLSTPRKQNRAGLKISCAPNTPVDALRLREIVRSVESAFWEKVAGEYGGVSGDDLMRIWREESGYGPETPPTPGVSPKAEEVAEFNISPHAEVESIAEEDDDVEMTPAPSHTEESKAEVETVMSSPTPTAVSVASETS